MKKRLINNTMTAQEYSEWYHKTKVTFKNYPHIVLINKLGKVGTVSNQKLARELGQDTTGVGRACNQLETNGVIRDKSEHNGRRDWELTEIGEELCEAIYTHMGVDNWKK